MQEYSPSDIRALQNVQIIIRNELNGGNGKRVRLQFPPRVTSDGKSSNWMEFDIASYEPLAVWRGSSARSITVEFDYVVDGSSNHEHGVVWDIETIASQLRLLKSYFYVTLDANQATFPLVKLVMYDYAPLSGFDISTWRMKDIKISPSGPIIENTARASVGNIALSNRHFHLKHTVSMTLDLFTRNNQILEGGDGFDSDKLESDPVAKLKLRDSDKVTAAKLNIWF